MSWTEEQLSAIVKKSKARTVNPGGMHIQSERKIDGKAKPTKYRAVCTVVDGITFASKKEAARFVELKLREKAGEITDLKLQPKISLDAGGMHICNYIADFFYLERLPGGGVRAVHEDCKGMRTQVYKIKKKLVRALVGIEITET